MIYDILQSSHFIAPNFFVPGLIKGATIGYGWYPFVLLRSLNLGSFPELFQVTGFFYGGTFSRLFFAGDGGGDLAHTLWFPCPGGCCPFISMTRRCFEGRL
jgi:hypothetical protein